jgi:hypothetical protein
MDEGKNALSAPLWAITRDLAINLYRGAGFTNMAQAQRLCSYGLKHVLALFRMK